MLGGNFFRLINHFFMAKKQTKKRGKKGKANFNDYLPFILLGAAVLVTVTGIYLVVKDSKAEKASESGSQGETNVPLVPPTQTGTGSSTTTPRPSSFSCLYDDQFPLQYGSCGSNVETWQRYLNTYYNANLSVDGKFGSRTEAATKSHPAFGNMSQFHLGRVNMVDFGVATFNR